MLDRKIITTADGSTSIHIPEWNEQYHSTHGAIQEAYHVFIKNGLDNCKLTDIHILEIGFGTGLNCFITFLEGIKKTITIDYTGIEAYPITETELNQLNYIQQLQAEKYKSIFYKIHSMEWNTKKNISKSFNLTKQQIKFQDINDVDLYNIIYFDAFGARVQPELWTEKIFTKMYTALKVNGILVTYSAKGSVRRALQKVGFTVERLPGPPGKREMLRATKE